jgi:hypothetical protein
MRNVVLMLLLSLMLWGRENPFRPLVTTTQESQPDVPAISFHSLTGHEIIFPNDAKILRKVAAQYQKYDGTTGVITKEINEELDWRKPLILSQSSNKKFHVDDSKNSLTTDTATIDTEFVIKESFTIDDEAPRRFVVDFLREKGKKPVIGWTQSSKLSRVVIGKHSSKIRVVFYISPSAKPNIKQTAHGYSVSF